MKKNLLFAIAFLLVAFNTVNRVQACTCMPAGFHFCETLHNDPNITLVGAFRKIASNEYGFVAVRLQTFYGTETRDTITIWGDNGALCRAYDGWNVGDTIIMALQDCDTLGNWIYNPDYPPHLESIDDYQVSVCGVYTLEVFDGIVTGFIDNAVLQTMPYNVFVQNNCALHLGQEEEEWIHIDIYPVPAHDFVTISNLPSGVTGIALMDMSGKVVLQQTITQTQINIPVDVCSNGVYIIQINTTAGSIQRKIIINR